MKNKEAENMHDGFRNRTRPGRLEVRMALRQPSMLNELRNAEIIYGIDEVTQNEFVVFGWDVIDEIAASETIRVVNVMRFPVHQETLELEALLAATTIAKGRHEYVSPEDATQEGPICNER